MGLFLAGFGICGIIMQLSVPFFIKTFPTKQVILLLSSILCFAAMFISGFTSLLVPFAIALCIYGLFNGLRNPMLNAIIADNTERKAEQGKILGINQSYASIGQNYWSVNCRAGGGHFSTQCILFIVILHFSCNFALFQVKVEITKEATLCIH